MNSTLRAIVCCFWFMLLLTVRPVHSQENEVVFYLNEHYRPVVRLDRIRNASEGVRAILALYALENGAGCEGQNGQGQLICALTSKLGLGANCSDEHIRLVRSWFKRVPNLTSRWIESRNADSSVPGALEGLCYSAPDTGSWQNIWEILRVRMSADTVIVEGVFFGGSQYGRSRVRYITTYRVEPHSISEEQTQVTVLERSSKGIFER